MKAAFLLCAIILGHAAALSLKNPDNDFPLEDMEFDDGSFASDNNPEQGNAPSPKDNQPQPTDDDDTEGPPGAGLKDAPEQGAGMKDAPEQGSMPDNGMNNAAVPQSNPQGPASQKPDQKAAAAPAQGAPPKQDQQSTQSEKPANEADHDPTKTEEPVYIAPPAKQTADTISPGGSSTGAAPAAQPAAPAVDCVNNPEGCQPAEIVHTEEAAPVAPLPTVDPSKFSSKPGIDRGVPHQGSLSPL